MISIQGDRAALERELRGVDGGEGEKPKKTKASAGGSEYYRAKRIVEEWGRPLAFSGGEVWEFGAGGWTVCTEQALDRCNRVMGRNSEHGAFAVLRNLVAIPRDGAMYHRLVDRRWIPLVLNSNELLFSDYRLDLLTGESERIVEPVFGPRIMADYALDGDDPPRCAEFEAMIETALPNPEIRRHFQEVLSLVLQPHVHIRGQIVLWGRPGSRKSTIATAIACAAAGCGGASWVQEDELCRDKWASIAIHGKFVNVSDDSRINKHWASWMKRYSSGTMMVEAKFHKPESVSVTAKLVSTCNEMQSLIDASGAAADRLIPFRFDVVPARGQGVDRDDWLRRDFWSEPQRRLGVLTWLLEGLERLRQRGRYDEPASWLEGRVQAVAESDPIMDALLQNLAAGTEEDFVATSTVRALVPDLPAGRRGDMELSKYIGRMFPDAVRERRKVGGIDSRGWKNLKIS